MDHFQIDIFEIKPVPAYILRGKINLNSGKSTIDEVQSSDEFVFERIHQTPKSKLTFRNAERNEGLLYFYFITLENTHSYMYIIGQTNDRPIIRGGAFIEVDVENSKDVGDIVAQYIGNHSKKFATLYADKESPALIDALNKSIGQILDLIP